MKIALKLVLFVVAIAALVSVVAKTHNPVTTASQFVPNAIVVAGEGSPGG